MVKAVSILEALKSYPVLQNRSPHTTPEEGAPCFMTVASFGEGGIYAGRFQGESAWERHPSGDEIVQILDGAADVTVLVGDETHMLHMTAGMVTVVPKGAWHKFYAPNGVAVMTATPPPTEHCSDKVPPKIEE